MLPQQLPASMVVALRHGGVLCGRPTCFPDGSFRRHVDDN
jgi:hypothetical protein